MNMIGHSMGARVLASFFDKFSEIYINSEGRAIMRECDSVPVSVSVTQAAQADTVVDIEKAVSFSSSPQNDKVKVKRSDCGHLPAFGAMLFVNGEADLPVFQSG